mgnify:CR=1 FL=1
MDLAKTAGASEHRSRRLQGFISFVAQATLSMEGGS